MAGVAGPVLRFEPVAPPVGGAAAREDRDVRIAVLDTTWTPTAEEVAAGRLISVRDAAAPILASVDLLTEATRLLDAWVDKTTVIDDMTIDGTSIWYYVRLHDHGWLQQRILWALVVDSIVRAVGPSRIEIAGGADPVLVDIARLIAERDGLPFAAAEAGGPGPGRSRAWARTGRARRRSPVLTAARPTARAQGAQRAGRAGWPPRPACRGTGRAPAARRRPARAASPLSRIGACSSSWSTPASASRRPTARATSIRTSARSSIACAAARWTRSRSSSRRRSTTTSRGRVSWHPTGSGCSPRRSSGGVARTRTTRTPRSCYAGPLDVEAIAARIETSDAPLVVAGVDFGPLLARHVATQARNLLPRKRRAVERIRALIRQLHPAGILLADEYHRQDWLIAAAAEGVPVGAVQHGILYPAHNGYIHASRPPTLRLPDRTYVFGRWERDVLLRDSVFRPDEVVVGGSPRLDLVRPGAVDRDAVRAALGIAPGDRMVVVSGTHGPMQRRFHVPVALSMLVDRPLPGIHLVVKQHPGERDEGPYRAVIERAAAARGQAPPPVTLVQSIDLYQLLAAADAHIGIYSTVLTEAVMTATPNLMFAALATADLLGYVAAGVAIPVRSGGDVLAALAAAEADPVDDATRQAFLDLHFEPGSASERIAGDLVAWLT